MLVHALLFLGGFSILVVSENLSAFDGRFSIGLFLEDLPSLLSLYDFASTSCVEGVLSEIQFQMAIDVD